MRFMMLMIPKGYETAAPGTMPDNMAQLDAMMAYNHSLEAAGVLRAGEGLHPPSMGARISFKGGQPTVMDGPFAEAKEVLGGFWIIDVASRAEAIEWAKKCPGADNEMIEVRQIQEAEDWPEDMQGQLKEWDKLREGLSGPFATFRPASGCVPWLAKCGDRMKVAAGRPS